RAVRHIERGKVVTLIMHQQKIDYLADRYPVPHVAQRAAEYQGDGGAIDGAAATTQKIGEQRARTQRQCDEKIALPTGRLRQKIERRSRVVGEHEAEEPSQRQ